MIQFTRPSQTGAELDELFLAERSPILQLLRERDGDTFSAEIGATIACTLCGMTITASAMLACGSCAS